MRKILFTIPFLVFTSICYAQVTPNPRTVQWDHDGYATASRYDGGYFLLLVKSDNTCDTVSSSGTNPVQIDNLGKPTTTNGIAMVSNLVAKPIGCYVFKVRVLDVSGLFSDWSPQSNPFVDSPVGARNVVVK